MNLPIPEPAVKRKTLIFTAGVVWAVVGGILIIKGLSWLTLFNPTIYLLIGIGLLIGLAASRYGFSKIIEKNIERIRNLSPHRERICVFAFQALHSYLLVALMMTVGLILRLSPIPADYLAALYLAIGTALLRSSFIYFRTSRTI